jgi:hypothetical protein
MHAFLFAAGFVLLSAQAPIDPDVAVLRARDQALLDAISTGERKIWDEALAAEAIFVDESGTIIDRAAFLKQLEPMPAGVSGTIQIASYSATISGDLAIVVHTDEEKENYHGQILLARYLTTETWRRQAGQWKLHLVHVFAMLQDPPAISLPADEMRQYAGRYRAGETLTYLIQWDGKQLTGGRQGGSRKPIQVEARDVLFVPGQPRVRKVFQRDGKGEITGFVDRREGRDVVWKAEAPPAGQSGQVRP